MQSISGDADKILTAFKTQLSEYAVTGQPFLFVIDFECERPVIFRLDQCCKQGVFYDIRGKSNLPNKQINKEIQLDYSPVSKKIFEEKFTNVKDELNKGNTYLLNLTFPAEIKINLTLEEIFHISKAPYKLFVDHKFVVFSPECFIRISGNEIFTYPMKGTIDATVRNAEDILLSNRKEEWEHNTIVDLMRNDLAMVANNITVEKFRYVEKIRTNKGEILQTSSEIKGTLPSDWRRKLGDMILKLLPAGSVSGAPKKKTLEIIRENELSPRGNYTGIFGIFDGNSLDTAVAIRFIECKGGKYFFRSGGGITSESLADDEYNELIQKIYVPAF